VVRRGSLLHKPDQNLLEGDERLFPEGDVIRGGGFYNCGYSSVPIGFGEKIQVFMIGNHK